MSKSIQTNKEFVEAAGIAEEDAFIAVAIRRIAAQMTEIPARELVADMMFDDLMKRKGYYIDWDAGEFAIQLVELCGIVPNNEDFLEQKTYLNWFYNPDGYRQFDFVRHWFHKPDPFKKKVTFGRWTTAIIEMIHAASNDSISPPSDWPGLESSDLDSDAIAPRSPVHNVQLFLNWGCLGLLAIVAIVLLVSKIIAKS